ncbi:MAG: DUF4399 domain-containing protein [Gammaproteobacteria bacterium]|nr:DUF4399 domain-containing protein [Gammaproteobacteria bacterium]MDH5618966.1 DUF4399 domain-containing protein [Gammaproteobacteria bacterium]
MRNSILPVCFLLLLTSACSNEAPEPAAVAVADPEPAGLARTASVPGARVFFISPVDGATVSNPVKVVFGIEGMEVVAAGNDTPHSGHHHLLIDTGLPNLGLPIPKDSRHVHFGDGSTETEITLEPGRHSLQMLLGDHLHVPHEPPILSDPITILVE